VVGTRTVEGSITIMLQWCYSGATLALQWCYSGATVLQWCYSLRVDVSAQRKTVFVVGTRAVDASVEVSLRSPISWYSVDTVVIPWWYSSVTVVLKRCYSGTMVLQWFYSEVTVGTRTVNASVEVSLRPPVGWHSGWC
jgi:hypothetical protein